MPEDIGLCAPQNITWNPPQIQERKGAHNKVCPHIVGNTHTATLKGMVSGKWGFVGKMPPCARRVTPAQSEDLVDSTPPPSPKSAPPPPAIPPSQLQTSRMSVPALERMAFLRKPSLATATPPLRHIPAPATLATPEVSASHIPSLSESCPYTRMKWTPWPSMIGSHSRLHRLLCPGPHFSIGTEQLLRQ